MPKMNKHTLVSILVIGTLLVGSGIWQLWSLAHAEYRVVNFPPKGTTIIALGDSLTEGIGASKPENGYIGVLERRLNVTIENKGIAGDTTKDAERRLDNDVLKERPSIVLVFLGGNDYLKQVPQEETFQNLRTIITRIQSTGAVVLLVGIRGGLLHDKFDANFDDLARETGSLYVPNVLGDILGDPQLMSDEVHPNDAGYLKIADKIAPTLEGLVLSAVRKNTPPQ